MYHYEQILDQHRQRVARGAQNYERRRVAAEREAEKVVSESKPRESENVDEGVETETHLRLEATSSVR